MLELLHELLHALRRLALLQALTIRDTCAATCCSYGRDACTATRSP